MILMQILKLISMIHHFLDVDLIALTDSETMPFNAPYFDADILVDVC